MLIVEMEVNACVARRYIFCEGNALPEIGEVYRFREDVDGSTSFYVRIAGYRDINDNESVLVGFTP